MDFANMTDAQLEAEYSKLQVAKQPTQTIDYNSMSDAELEAQYAKIQQTPTMPLNAPISSVVSDSGFTRPEDVAATMTQPELQASIAQGEQSATLSKGTKATGLGVLQMGYDVANIIGADVTKLSDENKAQITQINKEISDVEAKYGTKGDFFTPANVGRLLPSVATLPLAVESKMAGFFLEGSIAYAESRGEDKTITNSLVNGLIAGGVTAGLMKGIEMISTPAATKVYQYVKEHNNITDKAADDIFNNWAKVMDAPDTPANRTKAIVDSLGDKGAEIKREAAAGSPSAVKEIEGEIKARRDAVKDLTEGRAKVEHTAEAIDEASNIVKQNYANVKAKIVDKPTDLRLEIPDALDEATTGDASALKGIFGKEELTVNDLVDSMPHLNSLLRKTKGTTNHKWSIIKDEVETSLQKSLSKEEFSLWKEANSDYAKMANVVNSKIGKIITQVQANKITPELAMKQIKTASGGKDLFTDIEFMIGREKTAAFEKAILREAMGKNSEFVDWAHIARNLDSKGFITEEGKNLKKVVDDIAGSFMTDDAIQAIMFKNQGLSAGMSDDLLAKVRYSVVGKMFTGLVKRLPFSESSKHMLRMDQLADILRNPTKVKELSKQFDNLGAGVKARLLEDSVNEAIKQIEYKPGAKTTGDVNLDTKYVTKSGTIAETPTEATLAEAQTQLLRDYLKSPLLEDKVIPKVHEVMNGNRINNILKQTNTKMKIDDIEGNKKMLQTIVTKEAEELISYINKSTGVILPKSEADKIIKLKIADMLKDCE